MYKSIVIYNKSGIIIIEGEGKERYKDMIYSKVKSKEIVIVIEGAQRTDKIKVWGCFYGKGGKDFERYFDTMEKACKYYNDKLNMATKMYMEKCN